MVSPQRHTLTGKTIRRMVGLLAALGFGFLLSLLLAPSAQAVSGPSPSPGFSIVVQKCKEIRREPEQQPDGFDTTVVENEDGTTTTISTPRYKTVWVTITQCDWIEQKISTGQGTWEKRPELMKSVPCNQIDFFGFDPEEMLEFCKDAPEIIEFPVRGIPEFSDPDAETAYLEYTVGDFSSFGGLGSGLAYKQIADPATQSALSTWPCWLTAIDNTNPTIEIINNLSLDRIDWAKYVNYTLTRYNQGSITFRSPNSMRPLLMSETGPTHIGTDGETLQLINSNLVSTAEWRGCKSSGGGTPSVTVSCPVFYNDVEVDGPYGKGLPALRNKNERDPLTIRRVVPDPGKKFTEFGARHWPNLTSPKKYADRAMRAIALVQGCGGMDQTAAMNFRLKSPGNYDLHGRLYSTTCSYSLMPGFANGAYFGGCTGALTSQPIKHTYHAGCSGLLSPGHNTDLNFDPALCFAPECRWTNTGSNYIHGRDLTSTPRDRQHFDDNANIPLRQATGTGARADGSPIFWDGSLDRIRIVDSTSGGYVGNPVDGTEFAVFEIDPNSTPWNPRVDSDAPNHRDQWFRAQINETEQANPLVVLAEEQQAKNVPAGKRFTDWNNLNISAYQPSERDKPFILKFHRIQGWTAPVRVGGIASLSEYQLGAGTVTRQTMEPTITCSTRWSVMNFVGRKIIADAR